MGKNKKSHRFNKKEGVRFNIVARSQADPLSADPNASQNVLMPIDSLRTIEKHFSDSQAAILQSIPSEALQVAEDLAAGPFPLPRAADFEDASEYARAKERVEMERAMSMFRVDENVPAHLEGNEYDNNPYIVDTNGELVAKWHDDRLHHLNTALAARAESKEVKSEQEVFQELGIALPKDARLASGIVGEFGTESEHMMPADVLRALEAAQYDNADDAGDSKFDELPDNFFELAAMGGEDDQVDDDEDYDEDGKEEPTSFKNFNELTEAQLAGMEFDVDEEFEEEDDVPDADKKQLDRDFDALLGEFDEDEMPEGDSDDPDMQGEVEDIGTFASEIRDFANRKQNNYQPHKASKSEKLVSIKDAHVHTVVQTERLAEEPELSSQEITKGIDEMFPPRHREKWDVQSIVSTFTNTENHPIVLDGPRHDPSKHIKLSKKTGMPIGYLGRRVIAESDEEDYDDDGEGTGEDQEVKNAGERRNKKETKEEKKARKLAVKEAKRKQREKNKQLKEIYKHQTNKLIQAELTQRINNPVSIPL